MKRRRGFEVVTGTAVAASLGTMAETRDVPMLPMPDGISILDSITTADGTMLLSCSNGRILTVTESDYGAWSAGWRMDIPRAELCWRFVPLSPAAERYGTNVCAEDGGRLVRVWSNR